MTASKRKKSLVGWTKKNWMKSLEFYYSPKSYATNNSRQHRKKLRWINIFDRNDIYYDKRNRHQKVKVAITIKEIR